MLVEHKMEVQYKPEGYSTPKCKFSTTVYQVNTAETKADSVFVSWITQPNGLMSYQTRHIKNHFSACVDFEDTEIWKVFDIMPCSDDRRSGGSSWDVFVSIGLNGESAEVIGGNLAATFTAFLGVESDNTDNFGNCDWFDSMQQGYTFGGVASSKTRLLPVLDYLSEEDTTLIFKAYCNAKEHFTIEDNLLVAFFGTAEKGRDLIERT